jgi:Abnormal spindle-like microcephaly-assoc'd, ASPM-SPD-2-Hydin/Transmembrane protein 131-like N-terminal/CARDB
MARGEAEKGISKKFAGEVRSRKLGLGALLGVVLAGTGFLGGCAGLANTSTANPTPQDQVQITPALLTFPNVSVGQQATQVATITNTGSKPVSITQLSLSSNEFTATGIATPLTLGPGQSTQFKVSFKSSTTGTVSGTLSAMSRGGGSTKVKLNGNAGKTASQLSLSTSNLKYGNVLVHGSSSQAVTLQNSGSSDVSISQLNVTGAGFSASGVVVPFTLSAGQSATLEATFAPATAGAATGSVTIASDAQTTSSSVALSGTGVNATYTMLLNPTSVVFGNLNIGSTAKQTVQLSNTGNTSFTVTQVAAAGAGISVSGLTVPATIAPSQSVPLTVTFAPTAVGATAGSLTVTNDGGVNVVGAVTGTGVQAGLSVTPTSASFGSVVTGNSNSQTIQIKNIGTASLTVSQVAATGSGFSVSGVSVPLTLAPGASSTFNVQYAPTAAGAVNGSVSIVSNAPNSPAAVSLSGTGVAATYALSVSPGSLSFGSVNNGSTALQGFTVTNTGNSNVAISGMSASGAGYSIVSGGSAVTLSPNQSASVSVQFAPAAAGSVNGMVMIASNASGSNGVSLSGTGVAPQINHTVALNWGASSSSVAGYNVYRSSVSGSSYAKLNSSLVGGASFTDSNVQAGQTYYYVATAVDAGGNESVYSNEVPAVVP